jgi:hypothetical protein
MFNLVKFGKRKIASHSDDPTERFMQERDDLVQNKVNYLNR